MTYKDKPITKRLVVCALGVGTVYWIMWTHRSWEWAYFASIMEMRGSTAKDVADIAIQSGKDITTMAIAASGFIFAIIAFFITGNVSVLKAAMGMTRVSAAASSVGEAISERMTSESTETQIIKDMSEQYKDDPSYRPIQPDTTEVFR